MLRSRIAIFVAVIWAAGMLVFAMTKETPVGNLEGKVIASDTGGLISGATVRLYPEDQDEYGNLARHTETDKTGAFRFENIEAGSYIVEASARVHNIPASKVAVQEGRTQKIDLEMRPSAPYLNLYVSQQMFTSKETPSIVLDGFTPDDVVDITIRRIKTDALMTGGIRSLQSIVRQQPDEVSPAIESTETMSLRITERDSEGVYHQTVSLGRRPAGIYVISATTGGLRRGSWISVSDLSVITKESGSDILAYAVRPDTGMPVNGAEVRVFQEDQSIGDGVTDADGLWKHVFAKQTGVRPNRLIIARLGDSVGFVRSYSYDEAASGTTIYTYTDRPVYRPGHWVNFKGIIRNLDGDAYRVEQGEARVEVRDKRNSIVYMKTLPLSKFGSFKDRFKLPSYAPTGGYDVSCTYKGHVQTTSFVVAEYRKPEFSVTVEMPKARCVRGEKIKAKVKATYYFGSPVVGAEVRYSIYRSGYWFWPYSGEDYDDYGDSEYAYEDYGDYGEMVREGVVRTGPDGTAEVEFPANWRDSEEDYSPSDQQFSVSASVTDASRREASGEGTIIATQGDFKLDVQPEGYLSSPNEGTKVTIAAIDYDRKPRRDIDVEVTAFRTKWVSGEEERIPAASGRVKTDDSGRAVFSFKPSEAGSYVVQAVCRDSRGNRIKSSSWIWVSGEDEFEGYRYPELEIVLDKKTYNPGDTAKVLINASEPGAMALLTVEGRRLFDHRLVKLESKSTVVEIPVEGAYKPNFFVSVCYVKDKKFVSQEAGARVSLKHQSIKLTVTADRKKYEPGDKASYLVKAVDSDGKPVQAEVSLGIVDESIYAILEDDTTPIRSFFYARRPKSVTTRYSFPEIYLSGDKAGYTGKVRQDFKDTAFWRADLVTDENGEARATFTLPDNLTTWRATARACTMDTAVGESRSSVVVTKKLLVRLESPRFFTQKDDAVMAALVHNYLPKSQRVEVTLKAPGLTIRGPLTKRVDVKSGGMQRVEWRVIAPKSGDVTITAYAVAPDAQDAMRLTIPVRPHGQRLVENRTGAMPMGRTQYERLLVRSDAVSGASGIRIRLAPSLASTIIGSLDYLAAYPYGCVEQTASTFLPDVVVWQTLKSLDIDNPELERRLPDMVGKGLNRLYDFQNADGGWGWCSYSDQDMWMTAYVVYCLITARSAGFAVNDEVLQNGLSALERQLQNQARPMDDLHNRIYALYVMSLTGGRNEQVAQWLQPILQRGVYAPEHIALVAMTLGNIGRTDLAKEYMTRLWRTAIVTDGEIHWGDGVNWYDMPSTEQTALALMALVKLTPDDTRIPRVIRWIISRREFNHWYSTRDTAMIVYALSEFLKMSNELQPEFTAAITHNGRQISSEKFDAGSVFGPEREIIIKAADVGSGRHTIELSTEGTGVLYYTVELVQYVEKRDDQKLATGSGITVTREYHKLVTQWDESAKTNRLQPARRTSTSFASGDVIQVRLIVKSPRDYYRVIVEDYLPAGCEAFDRGRMEPWEWSYWYDDVDVRDERVTFYVNKLPRGQSILEYQVRAGVPGVFHAVPTIVQGMYRPDIKASGVEDTIRIR